jgi:hypothetical protein
MGNRNFQTISGALRGSNQIMMLAQIAILKALSHGKPDPATTSLRKAAKKYKVIR